METYIWQHPEWPHFIWDAEQLAKPLAEVRIKQGILIGRITTLGFETELNTALDVMKLMRNISERGTAVLMATHNYTLMQKYPSRIANCKNGTVICSEME